jgi:hypothetical protein
MKLEQKNNSRAKRDDAWFATVQKRYDWTNQYCWFHVMKIPSFKVKFLF